ncbi:MAG: right-handed parallel beta-helix repeat-containing protein [Phycisphaerae bacterium]|nr:right-handed parallel beta-helix repeat-containing protein [Phycisphaerae bacterium]
MKHVLQMAVAVVILTARAGTVLGGDTAVRNAKELRNELRRVRPGDTITLAPGNYGNGIWIAKVNGTKKKPIIITGADDRNRPVFSGGAEAIHLSDCNYVVLRNMKISGCSGNGVNADDAGSYDTPSKGVVFENIAIEDIGPAGNRDGLKLSGLDDFVVRNCRFSGWGGSAIDMVGCHNGVIEKCQFVGKKGYSQSSGIQAKGGSEKILIRRNFFKNAGGRAINLGGSTGLKYFRPKLRDYEARTVEVVGNHFVGGAAPIAYVTSIDCVVRRNTIIAPEKWVMRILQEQPTAKFKPCQRGAFEENLIVFDRRVRTFVNIGPNTRPETFSFRGNAWFCSDGDRRPSLPSKEIKGVYQVDPKLASADTPDMKVRSKDPRLRNVGAHAFKMKDADTTPESRTVERDAPTATDKPRR